MKKFTCDYSLIEAENLLREKDLQPQELAGVDNDVSNRAAQNTYSNARLKTGFTE